MPDDIVHLYRITHRRYAETPFSGEGGLYYNSRWATKGQRVSYAADHLALATLEKIAGVQRVDLLTEMVYVRAKISSSHVTSLADDDLPDNWDALPARQGARVLGDKWLAERRSLLLRVPSVVLPHSYNYVVNAAHPDARKLEIVDTEPLLLDNRVLRLLGIGAGSP